MKLQNSGNKNKRNKQIKGINKQDNQYTDHYTLLHFYIRESVGEKMIQHYKPIYKLARENWTALDISYLDKLQRSVPQYFEQLELMEKGGPSPASKFFRLYATQTKLCLVSENQYYHCYDCSLMKDAGLCRKCFNIEDHKDHNWECIQIKNKPHCDCGFNCKVKKQSTCKSHTLAPLNNTDIPLSEQQVNNAKAFLTIYAKLVILRIQNPFLENQTIFDSFKFYVAKISSANMDYSKILSEVFSTIYNQKSQKNILRKLFQFIFKKNIFYKDMLKLCLNLCNVEGFQCMLIQAFFKQMKMPQPDFVKFYLPLAEDFSILNELGGKGVYPYCQPYNSWKMFDFYTQILQKRQSNNKLNLIQIWKHFLAEQKSPKIYVIINLSYECVSRKKYRTKNYFFEVLLDSTSDFQFFQKLITLYISNWYYRQDESYSSKSQIYNQFVRICLHAVKGNIDQIPTVFANCDKSKLSKFILSYVSQIINPAFAKCRFNTLTMKCLLKIITKFELNCMDLILFQLKYSPVKVSRTLAIVIRNMTTFKNYEYLNIYNIAKTTGNIELANQMQEQFIQWLKQYLIMNSCFLSKYTLKEYRNYGLKDSKKFKEFISNSIRSTKNSHILTYIGQKIPKNPCMLLQYILNKKQEIYDIYWDDHKQLYYQSDNAEILNYLFTKLIPKVNLHHYHSCTNDDKYRICMTAVLLNKITNQQNQVFVNFVKQLRDLSAKMLRDNKKLERFLRIKNFALKQQKIVLPTLQQTIKIEEVKAQVGQQLSIQVRTQTIQKIQQTSQKVEMPTIQIKEQVVEKLYKKSQIKIQAQQQLQQQGKQQKQQEQLQVPTKVQKTPSVARRHEKKNLKMKKFSQKLANRSQKFLSPEILSEVDQQNCLVCKQTANDFSLLFYYASIQKSKATFLNRLYSNLKMNVGFNLGSCLHLVHETCIKKNNKKCILCSTGYDILIPAANNKLDKQGKQIIVMMWWNQCFKPEVSKIIALGKQQNQKYFLYLFKSLLTGLGLKSLIIAKPNKNLQARNIFLLNFLNQIYRSQTFRDQVQIKVQLNKFIKENCVQGAKFMNKIQYIISTLVLYKLENNMQQPHIQIQKQLYSRLQQVSKDFQFRYCRQTLKNIQFLMGKQYEEFYPLFQQKPDITQLLRQLQIVKQIPENLRQLNRKRVICDKCKLVSGYVCLSCGNKDICSKCVSVQNHLKKEGCVFVSFDGFIIYEQDSKIVKLPLYINQLCLPCQDKTEDWRNYRLDKEILFETISKKLMQ